eukprot:1720916-Rhodomonas_salina.1
MLTCPRCVESLHACPKRLTSPHVMCFPHPPTLPPFHVSSVSSHVMRLCPQEEIEWTPLKPESRAVDKVLNHYLGDVSRITDLCRETLVVGSLSDVADCLQVSCLAHALSGISLCACYALSGTGGTISLRAVRGPGTDRPSRATRLTVRRGGGFARLWYRRPAICYALPTPCPVLRSRTLVPGGFKALVLNLRIVNAESKALG